jgi:hypothetical protein
MIMYTNAENGEQRSPEHQQPLERDEIWDPATQRMKLRKDIETMQCPFCGEVWTKREIESRVPGEIEIDLEYDPQWGRIRWYALPDGDTQGNCEEYQCICGAFCVGGMPDV